MPDVTTNEMGLSQGNKGSNHPTVEIVFTLFHGHSFPWDKLAPRYNWAAMDDSGDWFGYELKPGISGSDPSIWNNSAGGTYILMRGIEGIPLDFKDTLMCRPEDTLIQRRNNDELEFSNPVGETIPRAAKKVLDGKT